MRWCTAGLGAVVVVGLLAASGAMAEGLNRTASTASRAGLFKSQLKLLDTRLAVQYEDSVRLKPDAKPLIAEGSSPRYRGNYKGEYLEIAKALARKHGIPEDLFLRLVQQESGWNIGAVSRKGATGLAQLMPATARGLGVDINDPVQNLEGGARYLRRQYDRFGTWKLALAAYNAGPEAVEKSGGIPPYKETQGYVLAIWGG